MNRIRMTACALLLIALMIAPASQAQQFEGFGNYEVHYNVLNSDQIPATVAQGYGIQRSANRALLNITILDTSGETPTPIHARVSASAVNLTGQRREIELREISDSDDAVYYIGLLPVHNMETYNFTVNVQVEGEADPFVVSFRQQFFTE
ncbi:DUF4426 domain-containing protein [Elongatibacter sediminis]|uniref:DUF4426 domain-containing protein n=1 Tax=Elongatibacter sediminis TaxID=3119006 RepID=A0AAW9R9L3_9GAMM